MRHRLDIDWTALERRRAWDARPIRAVREQRVDTEWTRIVRSTVALVVIQAVGLGLALAGWWGTR